MKKTVITLPRSDSLICITENFTVTAKTLVTVPIQYSAFIYIDDVSMFRLSPCTERSLSSKFGADIIGKQAKVAFVHWKNIERTYWRIEDYRPDEKLFPNLFMDAVGSIVPEIVNYPRLISVFGEKTVISEDDVKKKISTAVTNIISPILAEKRGTSCSELSVSLISEELDSLFKDELILASIGVRINEFDISSLTFTYDE